MRDQINYHEDSDQLDLGKLLSNAVRHWYFFVIGLLVCVGVAFLYLRYKTPLYYVSSKILIKDDKRGPELKGDAVFNDLEIFKSSNNIDNEIEVLKSRSLMQRVLTELGLHTSYYLKGKVVDKELYGARVPVQVTLHSFDSAAYGAAVTLHLKGEDFFEMEETTEEGIARLTKYKYGEKINRPYGSFTILKSTNPSLFAQYADQSIMVKFHTIEALANYYNSMLLVEPVNKTASALYLGLEDPVAEKARDIINKLLEVYNKEEIEDKNYIATSTIAFLDERLKFITEELTHIEKEIEQYKRKKEITDVNSQARLYVDNESEYQKQLLDWNIQINVLESLELYLRRQENQHGLVPSTLGIKDPTLLELIGRFNALQLERERMLRTNLPNNPLIQNIDVQLADIRVNLLENLRNIKQGLTISRKGVEQSSSRYASKIQEVPAIERHLLDINRQQSIKQGLYLYMLQKREESALALAATVSNIRIIDPAVAGEVPTSPNKMMVLLMASVLGMGLPFGLVYIRYLMNDKVQERKDVELLTTAPILGEIAHSNTREAIVVTENSRIPAAELFRLLRINLYFSSVGKENKVIMVTSSMSGDGKTFFGLNLGASLAVAGKKVALLDLDLRNAGLTEVLGLTNKIGITDYVLTPAMKARDIFRPMQAVAGMYVAGTGALPENPSEFSMHARLEELIQELKESFDHIIIDTAPVGLVADAYLLAPMVDTTLYLVRYNHTYKPQIGIIDDIFKENKLKNAMIVLNDAKKPNSYGYGYGKSGKKNSGKKQRLVH